MDNDVVGKDATSNDHINEIKEKNASPKPSSGFLLACSPCAFICNSCSSSEESSEQMSEEGMFYCSLCEVEVSLSIRINNNLHLHLEIFHTLIYHEKGEGVTE